MGKKVDLNTIRSNNNNLRKNNHNFYRYNNFSENNNEENINGNKVLNENSQVQREYELPRNANITIKVPLKVKIALTFLIIPVLFILLMVYIVIFAFEETNTGDGGYVLGQTCTTVTVINTDNYIYDEDVSFDDYVAGVVAAESNNNTNLEYLKLLSIIARTQLFYYANSSCTVEGNSNFQKYQDVNDHVNSDIIKQASNSTKDLVVVYNEELISTDYCSGCVINSDEQYYYLRYNGDSTQKISKEWTSQNGLDQELEDLYSKIDKTDSNIESRECPENNSEYALSKIGSLHLITKENYTYEKTIKYYFGNDVKIIKNEFINASNGEFINPTNYINCTSAYGERNDPYTQSKDFHSGIDIGIAGGEPVYAVKSGKITRVVNTVTEINSQSSNSSNGNGYGNNIVIDHGDGTSTLYAHLKYGSIPDSVIVGTTISQGTQIGQVGSTGRSTGNHLHYEVRINDSTVNPADYLDLTNATGECKK